jgi:hypothetical protein
MSCFGEIRMFLIFFKYAFSRIAKRAGWREVSGKELMPNFRQKKRHLDKVSFFVLLRRQDSNLQIA